MKVNKINPQTHEVFESVEFVDGETVKHEIAAPLVVPITSPVYNKALEMVWETVQNDPLRKGQDAGEWIGEILEELKLPE